MDRKEAIQAMINGHKVRQVTWENEKYAHYSSHCFRNQFEIPININIFPYAVHWELYVESKKEPVKMAPALLCVQGEYKITQELFRTVEEAVESGLKYQFVKLLMDTHAVEVEVYG